MYGLYYTETQSNILIIVILLQQELENDVSIPALAGHKPPEQSSGRSSALRCTALLYPNVTSIGGVFKSTQKQRIFQYLKRYLKRSPSLQMSNYRLSFQVVRDLMFLCAIHCLPIIFQQCRFLLHIATCN